VHDAHDADIHISRFTMFVSNDPLTLSDNSSNIQRSVEGLRVPFLFPLRPPGSLQVLPLNQSSLIFVHQEFVVALGEPNDSNDAWPRSSLSSLTNTLANFPMVVRASCCHNKTRLIFPLSSIGLTGNMCQELCVELGFVYMVR